MKPGLCMFTDSLEPSGVGQHMLTLITELRETYRIFFVCPPSPAATLLFERAGRLGVEVLPLEVRQYGPTYHEFCNWLGQGQIDIFHCHAGIGWEGHWGIHAARDAGIASVVRTEHLPDLITDPDQRHDYRRMETLVDRIICVSHEARDSFYLAGVSGSKLRIVHNGVHPLLSRADRRHVLRSLELPDDARIILTVARMTEQKGHRYLVEAIHTIANLVPQMHFIWVGEGPLLETLKAQVCSLNLQNQVHFAGHRHDVPDLLTAADGMVLPSLFEGLPLVVLEAMSAGLPVIGTRICGTSEVIEDGISGRLVRPGDPAALAAALLELIQQHDLAASWGQAGYRRVAAEFSAKQMAQKTMAIYRELISADQPLRKVSIA